MRSFSVGAASLLFVLVACSSSNSASPSGASACTTEDDCPTYVCTCKDGTPVSVHSCAAGACATSAGLCDGCGSHGGSDGTIVTTPPHQGAGQDAGTTGTSDSGSPGGGSPSTFPCDNGDVCTCFQSNPVEWAQLSTDVCDPGLVDCGKPCGEQPDHACCPTGKVCMKEKDPPSLNCPGGAQPLGWVCAPAGLPPQTVFCHPPAAFRSGPPDYYCLPHDGAGGNFSVLRCAGPTWEFPDSTSYFSSPDYGKCIPWLDPASMPAQAKAAASCKPAEP